jgi:UDP-2,3-diacylglucosamine pyrophosphatase LpxH
MTFAFDLISDLHVETWDSFDWTGQPTAPYCVVAGDVSRDRDLLVKTLKHLSDCYAAVFYIDGNDEHRYYLEELGESYRALNQEIENIPNVVYMQDNVVIINGVAIIATNGWWNYTFDRDLDPASCREWYREYVGISELAAYSVADIAYHDAAYLCNSIKKLQTHPEVKRIVVVSHTLPSSELVKHDLDLFGHPRFNSMGNQNLSYALEEDTENKISVWCFGHYHRSVDRDFNGIRYVNNPRGRGDTPWSQPAYYPKRIEIKI